MRIEKDSLGEVVIPDDAYYGCSTARASHNFKVGTKKLPLQQIYSITLVKKACALTNYDCGKLSLEKRDAILEACDTILKGELDDQFVLSMYQSGSGTQSNMNVNEVIAGFANQKQPTLKLHPNDDVNMSQSTNDVFPTAMHLTTLQLAYQDLLPHLDQLIEGLFEFEQKQLNQFKVGRTHLQDAVSLSVAQEFSAFRCTLEDIRQIITESSKSLLKLAIGGTAVGTGLNTHPDYLEIIQHYLQELTGFEVQTDVNKFQQLSMKDGLTHFHHSLSLLASSLIKIANDIRFLGCGPRAGLSELVLPSNEPGSSIMPGKINPTQCESMIMVCTRILGNDHVINMSNSYGNFQLNVMMPLIIDTMVESLTLLSDSLDSFNQHLILGLKVNETTLKRYTDLTLMNAAALNPKLGYDKVSKCVLEAFRDNKSLKEVVLSKGYLSEKDYDSIMATDKLVYHESQE